MREREREDMKAHIDGVTLVSFGNRESFQIKIDKWLSPTMHLNSDEGRGRRRERKERRREREGDGGKEEEGEGGRGGERG